jgi:hypothetical protein
MTFAAGDKCLVTSAPGLGNGLEWADRSDRMKLIWRVFGYG